MLTVYTVAFFGHRYIEDLYRVETMLEERVEKLIATHEYVQFLVECNGAFDQGVASAVRRVKKRYREDNSSLVLVLPYDNAVYRNNRASFEEYYNDIEISAAAVNAHPKDAIQKRNREMVDRADLVIGYVTHRTGGAWKTIPYAVKKGVEVVNLATEEFNR